MNTLAILHILDSQYSHCIGNDTVEIRLRVAQQDQFDAVNIIYGNKYTFQTTRQSVAMKRCFQDGQFAYYIVQLSLQDVRLVYIFNIVQDGINYYYSEDGLDTTYNYAIAYLNAFQVPFINAIDVHHVVPWMKTAVFYEIFVDRFDIGDKHKDTSYINLEWGQRPTPKSFAGGDIKGIISRLDYIADLGVNALYLTPLFNSISNHKYDISDYYNVDRQFGTNKDLLELVDKCHQRGIKVLLDAVFNHCSDRLPQFVDVVNKGNKSKYYNWFMIEGDTVDKQRVNYQCFGSCSYMPKFNTSNMQAQNFLIDVAVHWIEQYDIDGWRLDVADEVSHNFWRNFRRAVKQVKEDCVIIGENWHDAHSYLMGDQYDSIMNYAFTKNIVDYFAKDRLDAQGMADRLSGLLMRNTTPANQMLLNLLDSHDTHRLVSIMKGNVDRLKCAIAVLFMYIGVPCIYYGTEVALEGGYDPDCRRTMPWQVIGQDNCITDIIVQLSQLKQQDVLSSGDIAIESRDDMLIIHRSTDRTKLSLYVNITDSCKQLQANAVLSHNYYNNQLGKDGFAIIEEVIS